MELFWKKISYTGIGEHIDLSVKELKRLIFFNQVLFVGLFGTLLQIIMVWPLIGIKALMFLLIPIVSLASLILNQRGLFSISRRLFFLITYTTGLITVLMLGGSGLYHIGVFCTFSFGLILFDLKKEKTEIIIGALFTLFILAIGEFGLFHSPDFSSHFMTPYFRLANLSNLIFVNSILTIFILQLNRKIENELSEAILQKEEILGELLINKDELEEQKESLARKVALRTSEISDQKETLEIQNKEKEVLLQEVHHRVKNNLQIIVSLINLQLSKFTNVEATEALQEIQARVQSMSLVHRKMYESNNFTEIKLKNYCDHLMENIQQLYSENPITFENKIPDDLFIVMDKAIPLGLILNEIVINFYKHAYDIARSENKLSIELVSEKDGYLNLKCSDNGPGFPQKVESGTHTSLGLEIIEGLTEQVDGEVTYSNDDGAVYSFTVRT